VGCRCSRRRSWNRSRRSDSSMFRSCRRGPFRCHRCSRRRCSRNRRSPSTRPRPDRGVARTYRRTRAVHSMSPTRSTPCPDPGTRRRPRSPPRRRLRLRPIRRRRHRRRCSFRTQRPRSARVALSLSQAAFSGGE
jgi:hypothetical protein